MNVISTTSASDSVRSLEDLQRTPTQTLGKDEFLQLLVMQLANQNPLEPTSDTDFIAQLAQFSALEQMQSLNSNAAFNLAYNLVGKYVYVINETEGETIFGKVEGVVRQNGIDYLLVGGEYYEMSAVTSVVDSIAGITDEQVLQSANLIGKTISADIVEDEETITVTGQVARIVIRDQVIYAVVGEREIPLSQIKEIYS